jgi:hypothetical protein
MLVSGVLLSLLLLMTIDDDDDDDDGDNSNSNAFSILSSNFISYLHTSK